MSDSSKKIVLKKLNSHNTIWHPESTLVFKSQKDRLVIGRYVDDEIIPLDDIAINLCETWKFKPDESLFEGEDENSAEESNDELSTEVPPPVEKISAPVEKISPPVEKISPPVEKIPDPVSNEINSDIENIQNITEGFTVKLYAAVNNLISEKNSISSKLHETEEILSDLQKKYDDIKKKFDTMKSLFN